MADFTRLGGGTWHGICQLPEWPAVTLFTATEPKGLFVQFTYRMNELFQTQTTLCLCNWFLFSLTGVIAVIEGLSFLLFFLNLFFLFCFVCGRVTICTLLQLDPFVPFQLSIPSMALYDLYVPDQVSLCLFNKIIITTKMIPWWFIFLQMPYNWLKVFKILLD